MRTSVCVYVDVCTSVSVCVCLRKGKRKTEGLLAIIHTWSLVVSSGGCGPNSDHTLFKLAVYTLLAACSLIVHP